MDNQLILILVLFQIKHFVIDYPLQSEYMLGKLNREDWRLPLAWHSFYHAVGTWIIVFAFTDGVLAFGLALLDFVLHFIIDRTKAMYSIIAKPTMKDPRFWNALGADQLAHQLTMIYLVHLMFFA